MLTASTATGSTSPTPTSCQTTRKKNRWADESPAFALLTIFLQNCVKMKFVADDSGNLEKAGWDDIDCEKKPIKSVCQYSVL